MVKQFNNQMFNSMFDELKEVKHFKNNRFQESYNVKYFKKQNLCRVFKKQRCI